MPPHPTPVPPLPLLPAFSLDGTSSGQLLQRIAHTLNFYKETIDVLETQCAAYKR